MASEILQIIERQIRRWEMEAQGRRQVAEQKPGRPQMLRPWVTISRAFGSGGGEIARSLGTRLGYQIFDREILDQLVERGHFRQAIVESLDDRDRSSLEVWVDGLLRGELVDKGDYLQTLVGVLGSIAMHGHAVILGRGANFILDSSRGLHVRVVAPPAQRVETICRLRGIGYERAGALVRKTDDERAAYVKRTFHRDIDDPLGYDLVINTERLGVETAAQLIERSLRLKLGNRAHIQF